MTRMKNLDPIPRRIGGASVGSRNRTVYALEERLTNGMSGLTGVTAALFSHFLY